MFDSFDVFRLDNDDRPMWEASAASFDDARARVQQLAASDPGNYLVFCQKTGHKTVIKTREMMAEIQDCSLVAARSGRGSPC